MANSAAIDWWHNSITEMGAKGMEQLLAKDASWEQVLQSGREDLARCFDYTQMTVGKDRSLLDVGCGIGRITFPLTEHFGEVVGVDVAPSLIAIARSRASGRTVRFELGDGDRIAPISFDACDTVFSYEVLYIVDFVTLAHYFRDIFALLKPGGEFVFQLNVAPLRWTTQVGYAIRSVLFAVGVNEWRGWPTGPGFRRYPYTAEWVQQHLKQAGFEQIRVSGPNLKQTWFVAKKPKVS